MRLFRWALVAVLLIVLAIAVHQTLMWLGIWGNANESQVKELGEGEQELAFIELATSSDDWGRLITAVQLMEHDWSKINPTLPALKISVQNAFPPLTADVPEIAFTFANAPAQKLWLRWYKISGEHDAASWVKKLHDRSRPPLAVIGGATSDRAIKLAYALKQIYDNPEQPAPVYIITTATAEETRAKTPLIGVYPGRSFRFSFTNQTMVDSLLTFIDRRQFAPEHDWARNLWVHKPAEAAGLATTITGALGATDAIQSAAMLRGAPSLQPYSMHAVSWMDERYSQDMVDHFQRDFKKRYPVGEFHSPTLIRSGVGGFFHPSEEEQITVDTFLARATVTPHSFLVLPTQTVRMRRFLINLRQRSPMDARNLVIFNGDAIAFHAIYRDRDVMWNILDLPYSLVFFSHRNPVDRAAGFRGPNDGRADPPGAFPPRGPSGTHDLLLYRDIFEALLYAVHDGKNLVNNPVTVRDRLRLTCWHQPAPERLASESPRVCHPKLHMLHGPHRPLFDADGDRRKHTGEHIVWLKPNFTDDIVDLRSRISVWTVRTEQGGGAWHLVDEFPVFYNQARQEGGPP